ncbi:MAG: nucleotide exchange factor GrpE [Fidelibacterota bacterium]
MTEEKKKAEKTSKKPSSGEPAKEKQSSGKGAKNNGKKSTASSKKSALSQKEIDKLILEHADMKAKFKEYQDNYLLLAAEFENFKKRITKDQQRTHELYKERILVELLPVIDDIERAVEHHKNDDYAESFAMIHSKLLSYLEKYNVYPFDSRGKPFDADKHDAMLTRHEEDKGNNIILEEFQKGYMIGDKVLRHAKVVVNITDEQI